jgi:hypothetical protein
MTVSKTEPTVPAVSDKEEPHYTIEEFRAAGLGVLSDEEIDDLIACVHEWRHEWLHKSEL